MIEAGLLKQKAYLARENPPRFSRGEKSIPRQAHRRASDARGTDLPSASRGSPGLCLLRDDHTSPHPAQTPVP